MHKFRSIVTSILCPLALFGTSALAAAEAGKTTENEVKHLIDAELSHFETWVGIPHESVTGLPEGTYQSGNVWQGTPMGLNADVKNIFSVIDDGGTPVLQVTGEIYAGLTTLESYSNYHLSTLFKWGSKKWAPRLEKPLDSGILYHCYGDHGRFWNVWMSSVEYQIMEQDTGDVIPLGANSEPWDEPKPKIQAHRAGMDKATASSLEKPIGEWNRLEMYTVGNNAIHLLNGEVVYVVENIRKPDGSPLESGPIQFQSEGAECYYKEMTIRPLQEFPVHLQALLRHQ